ncbi:MAG: hypothetical protein OEM02_00330 [Desulfobulbaceae bacterium]|nr:hypothetical protein [Desulfobulbaceae bacterium]
MKNHKISWLWLLFILHILLPLTFDTSSALSFEGDGEFGINGRAIIDINGNTIKTNALLIDHDNNKIIVGGSTTVSSRSSFALLRLNSNGVLDSSFQSDGAITTQLGNGDAEILALSYTADGKIIAAGYATVVSGDKDFALACYNADGSLYEGFGENGIIIGNTADNDEIHAVAVDSAGRIVVAGYSTGTIGKVPVLTRYLDDGTIDTTFGDAQGTKVIDTIGDDTVLNDLKILSNDSIVAVGSTSNNNDGWEQALVIRVSAYGQLDESFGDQGVAYPTDDHVSSRGQAISILEDGSLLAAGSIGEVGDRDSMLFLFTHNGTADGTFGFEGALNVGLEDEDDEISTLVVSENGIGMTGYTQDIDNKKSFLFIFAQEKATINNSISGSQIVINDLIMYNSLDDEQSFMNPESDYSNQWDISAMISPFGDNDYGTAIALLSTDKIIAVGVTQQEGIEAAALASYDISDTTSSTLPTNGDLTGSVSSTPNYTEVFNASGISTRIVTSITQTSAVSGGTIQDNTSLTFKKRGIVFSLNPDPLYPQNDNTDTEESEPQKVQNSNFITDGFTDNGSGTGTYSSKMNDLRPGTTYYVRAYGISEKSDIYYGNIIKFETSEACFIATAAYGSVLHPYVKVLRDFRDRYLIHNSVGCHLVDFYYHFSPTIANTIAANSILRLLTQCLLLPLIALSWLSLHPALLSILVCFIGLGTIIRIRRAKLAVKECTNI